MQNRLVRFVFVVLGAAVLVLIVYSSFRQSRATCEVCITYKGGSRCRTASGATREEAMRTAQDNACTFLTSGRAESIQCSNVQPASVTCDP